LPKRQRNNADITETYRSSLLLGESLTKPADLSLALTKLSLLVLLYTTYQGRFVAMRKECFHFLRGASER
jgi:hypothetical protein